MAYLEKIYEGDFRTGRGLTVVFGSRPRWDYGYIATPRFKNPEHTIGHIYYEIWGAKNRKYVGATDDFRNRMHAHCTQGTLRGVRKIVVAKYDNPKDRDDREVAEQTKSLPPYNRRVQRRRVSYG
jgi:hypothetical protein